MRKLRIDLADLEIAFTMDQMSETEHYLDLKTGAILMIDDDAKHAAEEFYEETEFEEEEDESEINEKFEQWLEEYDCPKWQVDSIRDAFVIDRDFFDHFIHIPRQESHDGYDDMVDFAETVTDTRLKELLSVALNGKGAFRRFKDVLCNYPEERKRFYDFSAQQLKERMLEWLRDNEIELIG